MKRDGGWTVELLFPLDGKIDSLSIPPVTLDQSVRWANNQIPSVLALLAELTGVKEKLLKKLTGPDTDRVLIAFSYIASGSMREDFQKGLKPISTPEEALTDEQRYEALAEDNDPADSRFPRVAGEVTRISEEAKPPEPVEEGGIDVTPKPVMRKVG